MPRSEKSVANHSKIALSNVIDLISFAYKCETNPDASGAVCQVEQCEGLFPELCKMSEQNEAETVMLGEHRSFHLTMEDDELLVEQGIPHLICLNSA
jgi:hypothetical protein